MYKEKAVQEINARRTSDPESLKPYMAVQAMMLATIADELQELNKHLARIDDTYTHL